MLLAVAAVPAISALLLLGCASADTSDAAIDLNAVAEHGQADIDNYAASTAGPAAPQAVAGPRRPGPPDGAARSASMRYRCMDGGTITVRFDDRAGTAAIVRGGRVLATLAGRRAGPGIRYASGGYELTGQGDAASLTTPGRPPMACTTIR